MALLTFPSGTNQQLFVSILDSCGISHYGDRGNDLWVLDSVLNENQEILDNVFSLGGFITGKTGFG